MPPLLLRHVDEQVIKDLQNRLQESGKLSFDFLLLLAGSTLIATFGLFQNSPAVIIGAMIVAPLMRPLMSISLATITADTKNLSQALLTLLTGTLVATAISATMATLLNSLELTPEVLGRTHPTLLDLGVALVAGAIGAYCQTKQKLSDTLAGVAIAVALVPPLSVVGIGIATGHLAVSTGAALLYATNLVGITMAGAVVFLIEGFSPLHLARKGLIISAVCITFLAIPLGFSMRELILENQISTKVRTILKEKTLTFRESQLRDVKVVRFRAPMRVKATILGSEAQINPHQIKMVQDLLIKEIGLPLEFRLRIIPSTELTAVEVSTESKHKEIGSTLPLLNDAVDPVIQPNTEYSVSPTIIDAPASPDGQGSTIESKSTQ